MRNLILLIYIFSTLASCDRLDGLDEGDRNTYTWKGQLVKDCDGQAAQNVSLTLESSYVGFPDGDMETIGETTTDENGKFSLKKSLETTSLVISYIGFETKKMEITSNTISVVLKEVKTLKEVTITKTKKGTVHYCHV